MLANKEYDIPKKPKMNQELCKACLTFKNYN